MGAEPVQIKSFRDRVLRRCVCAVFAVLLGLLPAAAYAVTYTDSINQLRLRIPEGENIYFYTPQSTNLFEDLLEQVQNSGRDVRILVRTYTPQNTLGYSFQVNAEPLPEGAIPEPGSVPEGSIYRDIRTLSSQHYAEIAKSIRSAYENRFNLSEPEETALDGLPALIMTGTGVAGTGWAPYDCKICIVAAADRLITAALIVESARTGAYRAAGTELAGSLVLGPAALAPAEEPSSAPPEPSASSAAQSQQTVPRSSAPSSEPAATPSRKADSGGFADGLTSNMRRVLLIVLILLAGSGVLIAVAVSISSRRKRRTTAAPRAGAEAEPPTAKSAEVLSGPPPDAGIAASGVVSRKKVSETREYRAGDNFPATHEYRPADEARIPEEANGNIAEENASQSARQNVEYMTDISHEDTEDSTQMASDDPRSRSYVANGHDYTEDVSRYTQQPSADVNDVSRYTHGVGGEADDDLQRLKDMPAETRRSRPSVGSRVAKNKSRSRRRK